VKILEKKALINSFINKEKLDDNFSINASDYLLDVGDKINSWFNKHNCRLCIGVNGAQGTGKSTISKFLKEYLKDSYNLSVLVISLDDLYKTKSEREILSKKIHPLLKTRGVPGTHDVDLGYKSIKSFLDNSTNELFCPRFNKNIDDRYEKDKWHILDTNTDIIILEGWCVGASHQKISDLIEPINDLEKNHDKDSVWRTYVNNVLQYDYQKLFSLCSYLIMLKPPSFQSIYEWRHQQEDKICNQSAYKMNKEQVINFVQYFQRLTVWMLDDLPSKSDILIEFDKNHLIKKISHKL
jgi:D-glycerate 3-kinase